MTKCHRDHNIYWNMQTAFFNLNMGKWKISDNELWSLISTNRSAVTQHTATMGSMWTELSCAIIHVVFFIIQFIANV